MAWLKVKYSRQEYASDLQSYNLKAEVVESSGFPPEPTVTGVTGPIVAKIFVMQRLPDGGDGFVCVADPVDLLDYPANAPDLDAEMPYFRVSEVELVFRSYDQALETRDDIGYDIAKLVKSLNAQAQYPESEEILYA